MDIIGSIKELVGDYPLKIKYGDISEMNKPQKLELYQKWEKLNKPAYKLSALYCLLAAAPAVWGVAMIFVGLLSLMGRPVHFFTNISPVLLCIALILFCSMINSSKVIGYAGTLTVYFIGYPLLTVIGNDNLYANPIAENYGMYAFLGIIPAAFIVRSLLNYPLYRALSEESGFPTFVSPLQDIYAPEIYIVDKELHKAEDDYKPWNAFDEEEAKRAENMAAELHGDRWYKDRTKHDEKVENTDTEKASDALEEISETSEVIPAAQDNIDDVDDENLNWD